MTCVAPAACTEAKCLFPPQIRCSFLAPAQAAAADAVRHHSRPGMPVLLRSATGLGRTVILRHLELVLGALYIDGARLARSLRNVPASELSATLELTLLSRNIVLVDDAHVLTEILYGGAGAALLSKAQASGIALVLAAHTLTGLDWLPELAPTAYLQTLGALDFEAICRNYLGESARRVDFHEIDRRTSSLDCHRLKNACLWLGLRDSEPDTESLLRYLNA